MFLLLFFFLHGINVVKFIHIVYYRSINSNRCIVRNWLEHLKFFEVWPQKYQGIDIMNAVVTYTNDTFLKHYDVCSDRQSCWITIHWTRKFMIWSSHTHIHIYTNRCFFFLSRLNSFIELFLILWHSFNVVNNCKASKTCLYRRSEWICKHICFDDSIKKSKP